MRAGFVADGRAGVVPRVHFGNGNFSATSRGRRAGPTTAVFKTCVTVLGAENVPLTNECGSTLACRPCGSTMQDVQHEGLSVAQRARADARAAHYESLGHAPRPRREPGFRDCMSVRCCVNFGDADGVGACVNAGRLVSRDGSAGLNIAHRGTIDLLGLDVPVQYRPAPTKRVKPAPLRLARTRH